MDWAKAFAVKDVTRVFLDDAKQYWVDVRDELTHGEALTIARAGLKRVVRTDAEGNQESVIELDRAAGASQKVLTYIADWNLPGPDGKTLSISNAQEKADAVRNLTATHHSALEKAIDAHVEEMVQKKRLLSPPSAPMSSSPGGQV